MSRKESRKTKRAQAARERSREAHAKLIVERQGDQQFVQQTRTPSGRTIHLRPQDAEVMQQQIGRFVDKFGREPTGDEPLFFDPPGKDFRRRSTKRT